ncbi:hypothetical protein VP395_01075 [Mariniflexile soesokkakense]|uniref:Uncharacterized protein n=1 Tax=Mariniflexile soesokkakense TaxID=1343160 RepID=A0ABV0A8M7_9FLAO
MNLKLTIISLLIYANLIGQNSLQKVDLNENYTFQNHSQEELNEYYFGLKPIKFSKIKYHFRYVQYGQIIDLKSNNGIEFSGELINEITESKTIKTDYGNDGEPTNYVFQLVELEKEKSSKIGQLILKEKIYQIPTDTLIKNWNFNWLHCGNIEFYCKTENNITSKIYTCPWNQNDRINEVQPIKDILHNLNEVFQLKEKYSEFINKLEKGKSYSKDGYMQMYIMTQKESESWRNGKPIRDYKKSIKDTINNYLELKLNELIPNSTELNCYDDYSLTFSKNGKLKRMKVDMGFWERLSDKDYKKCKGILKKVIREIKIDFVDPKYEFSRELSFGQKGIYIYDRMVY